MTVLYTTQQSSGFPEIYKVEKWQIINYRLSLQTAVHVPEFTMVHQFIQIVSANSGSHSRIYHGS